MLINDNVNSLSNILTDIIIKLKYMAIKSVRCDRHDFQYLMHIQSLRNKCLCKKGTNYIKTVGESNDFKEKHIKFRYRIGSRH